MFEVGDLVTMHYSCGGPSGGSRCETALVINIEPSHYEQVQVDSQEYHDKEVHECTLMCKCGIFKEYNDNLGMINESR